MDVIIREYTDSDAAAVAQMWNESNEGWPGGFLPLIDYTEARIRDKMREADYLALFIALVGDKVVGYCSLAERSSDRNVSYIPLLNAHPKYHGKKIGKRTMLAAVQESIRRGFDRLDLHTWAGNTKAVPLYKKVGFFWVPDTDVYMQNFMPLVFQNPIARRFFDKHDWYATQVRDLSAIRDEMSWCERDAYLYEWREGDDFLKIAIDRHCGGITCIETPKLLVSSRLDAKKPAIGMTHKLAWQFSNRTATPIKVSMRASGEEGLDAAKQASFDLIDDHSLEADVRVSADFPLKEGHETAPGVKTDIVIDGESMSIKTGVRAKYAIELMRAPQFISVMPGSSRRIQIALRNQLDEAIEGRLRLLAPDGVELKQDKKAVKLEANGTAGFEIEVSAVESGAHVVRPILEMRQKKAKALLPSRRFAIASAGLSDVVGALYGHELLIQNDFVKLWGTPRKGWMALCKAQEERPVVWLWIDQLGEPFSNEFRKLPYSVSIEGNEGAKVLVMRNKSEAFPGIEFEKRITVGSGPLVKLDYRVHNLSAKRKAVKLMVGNHLSESKIRMTIPMREGLLSVHPTDFPGWRMDVPHEPENFAETWSAFERDDGSVMGLIWKDASKVEFGGSSMPVLTFDLGAIPALATKCVEPLYLHVGDGNAESIRRIWTRLTGQEPDEELPVVDSVVRLEAEECPILMDNRTHNVALKLSHLRNAKAEGSIALSCLDGSVVPKALPFKDVNIKTPFEASVELVAEGQTRVLPLEATIETLVSSHERTFSIFHVKNRSPASVVEIKSLPKVAGKKVVGIDNGELSLSLSPDFAGSILYIKRNEQEYLNSAFPEAKARSWFNPWFGGIRAVVKKYSDEIWEEPDNMHKVHFEHKACQREDQSGHKWQGVRLVGDMVRDELKGLALQVDYLTRPGSNVLIVLPRVLNSTDAFTHVWLSLECFPARDRKDGFVTHYGVGDRFFTRKSTESGADILCDGWLCAENLENPRCLALVAGSKNALNMLLDLGTEGHSYFFYKDLYIKPHCDAGITWSLVATENVAEAKLCLALQSLRFKNM